jgi:predicted ArsR family transcriptional regulator
VLRIPKRRQIEALTLLREPVRSRLWEYVCGQAKAVSRQQAAEALGISRAVAAFHLDELVEAGLLRAEYRRLTARSGPGAGRPSKLYRRSRHEFSVMIPERNHELLAGLLAQSLTSGEDGLRLSDPASDYGRSLGARARRRLGSRSGGDRLLACVESVMQRLGFEPYRIERDEIRSRNCPFAPLSRRNVRVVCGAGVSLVTGIVDGVGASDVVVSRREPPNECCVLARRVSPKDRSLDPGTAK